MSLFDLADMAILFSVLGMTTIIVSVLGRYVTR
jgi:hypothetical protein